MQLLFFLVVYCCVFQYFKDNPVSKKNDAKMRTTATMQFYTFKVWLHYHTISLSFWKIIYSGTQFYLQPTFNLKTSTYPGFRSLDRTHFLQIAKINEPIM